jgi:ABC-type dipeptide/oligopeptide/nickel transport system permease component
MLTYVLRRLLLFVPTVLGATLVVFALLFYAPGSITDTAADAGGNERPEARAAREAYINERFGLNDPFLLQYARWLNNVSPIGLHMHRYSDPDVVAARAERREFEAPLRKQLLADDPSMDFEEQQERLEQAADEAGIEFTPESGSYRFDRLPIKVPDLGYSFVFQRPSLDLIAERLPITLLLNAISVPLALVVSIFTGVWSAKHRGGWQDLLTGFVLLALYSLPVIWVGVMLIGFLANAQQHLGIFPAGELISMAGKDQPFLPSYAADGSFRLGFLLDSSWHLVLPVLCLSYTQFAYLSKLSRTSLLEVLNSDYVRTARAKGLSGRVVLWRHAFRNALGPIITFLAALLPAIIAGSVVVERIFTIDGMGSLLIESLLRRDRELFLSLSLVTLLLTVCSYLLADLAYAAADPRVSYD